MDVLRENYEEKFAIVKLTNRVKNVKVYVPEYSSFSFWRISYEDGTPLSDDIALSKFTSKRDALKFLMEFEIREPMSKTAYQEEIFKDKGEVPVLKRKKVRAKVGTDSNSG